MAQERTAGIPAGSSSGGGSAKTYNIDPAEIERYISQLGEIVKNLDNAEIAITETFVQEGENVFPEVGTFIKEQYRTDDMGSFIESLKTAIAEYSSWLEEALAAKIAGDEANANKWANMGGGGGVNDGNGSGGSGTSSTKTTSPIIKSPTTTTKTTPVQTVSTTPRVTTSPAQNPSTVSPFTTPSITPTDRDPSSGGSGGSGSSTTRSTIPSSTGGGTGTSVLPTAAPTISPTVSAGGTGSSIVSPTVSATVSPTGSPLGDENGKNGKNGLASSLKGILDAGTSLRNKSNDVLANFAKGFGMGNGSGGGLLSAGTAAGLALAAGGAAVTTGILLKNKSKSYTFKPEDFEALPEETQEAIMSQFKEVKASEEEMDVFRTSTFMIAASVFDEHIRKAETSYENDINVSQEIIDNYGYEIYDEKGKVNKYLLFVSMLIDGCSETNEKNIYNVFNLALEEEDIDFIYSGLNMFDYIVKEEDLEDTSNYEEYEEVDGGGFDNIEPESTEQQTSGVEAWLQDMGAID